jgi:hypothetical protein
MPKKPTWRDDGNKSLASETLKRQPPSRGNESGGQAG